MRDPLLPGQAPVENGLKATTCKSTLNLDNKNPVKIVSFRSRFKHECFGRHRWMPRLLQLATTKATKTWPMLSRRQSMGFKIRAVQISTHKVFDFKA